MSIIKKLVIGFAVVAMVFGATVSVTSAFTQAEATALCAAISCNATQLAQIMAAATGSTGSSMTGSYAFNTNLTVGSRGADVEALQHILVDGGYLASGLPFGYFGPATKAAVIKWQTAMGITPAAGYVGSISRAKLNTMGGSMTPAPTTPTGTLCPNGMTLASNCMSAPSTTPTPTIPGQGTEGSITTRLAASPANDSNIRRTTDVSVYGIEVEAVNSDMSVDRADLQFTVTAWDSTSSFGSGSVQNPGIFVNTIKAWDGSTLLGSWPISSASFSKDSSDRYHVILSGLGFKVPKGTKKNITFSVSVNSIGSTDVPRRLAVQGYTGNTQNLRATDTIGLQQFSDMSGSSNTRTHDFKAAGASTLTVSLNNNATPKASNNKVNSTNGVIKKIMQAFDAKSESGNSKITKIYAAVNATSTAGLPSTLYLCDGADTTCASPLGSVTAGVTDGAEKLFNGLSILVPQDTTKTFLIAADFPTTANGQMASTSLMTNSVQWEKPDGSTASSTPSSEIAGNDHYFASAVPQWVFTGSATPVVTTPTYSGAASSTISAYLTFTVTAQGGSMTKPVIADFGLGFASSTQTTYTDAQLIGVGETGFTAIIDSITPSDATVGDGGSYTVKVKATQLAGSSAGAVILPAAANYKLVATSTKAVVGGNTITQSWNTSTWESPSAFFTNN